MDPSVSLKAECATAATTVSFEKMKIQPSVNSVTPVKL